MAARFGARKTFDWVAMQAYIDEGNGFIRCRARFGIAHATGMKAIRCGSIRVDLAAKRCADARKRFDWKAVQAYYDQGHTMRACQEQFGFASASWSKARERGLIRARPPLTIEQLAPKRSNRKNIKRRLLQSGDLVNRCAICGISDWLGAPITLQIDHINGKRLDYRLENLRILCPNCHSQTETFAGRNTATRRNSPGSSNGRTAVSDTVYRGSSP